MELFDHILDGYGAHGIQDIGLGEAFFGHESINLIFNGATNSGYEADNFIRISECS